jgi:3D-(3,5/4)-trihydroxycyclohexane-1,2-dione acylhydrolase (decyclizing)
VFQNTDVKFININLFEMDAFKHGGIPLLGDARETLREFRAEIKDYHVTKSISSTIQEFKDEWEQETDRLFHLSHSPLPAQSELIGAIWEEAGPEDVILSAAGSHPGDLHKLWRARTPKSYHLEYGYSCMGYEIPAAIGVKMADPRRDVFVWVGDGTYLMNPTEIVTSIQEGVKLIIIVVNNHGFSSIGGLSESVGSGGFGTRFAKRDGESGQLEGEVLEVDYAANASSLGASVISAKTIEEFSAALKKARQIKNTTVIVIETDREERVPGYESWWDVAIAEVSTNPEVQKARTEYEEKLPKEKHYL